MEDNYIPIEVNKKQAEEMLAQGLISSQDLENYLTQSDLVHSDSETKTVKLVWISKLKPLGGAETETIATERGRTTNNFPKQLPKGRKDRQTSRSSRKDM